MTGMILLGFGAFAVWLVQRRKAKATLAWPSVKGVVKDSKLQHERDSDGNHSRAAASKSVAEATPHSN